ncbi:DUF2798 domain-containing protein [Agarivorans gilvus]|uniref:DUF2798 domain-containing protein n=1 Tax=Agarivorans gilvus TaxID=680279 RepID=UPI00202A3131|nr:DUF2798 domain-containing protein [Agarivorans gilvus]
MKQRIVFTLIMSFFLSSLMTLWITYINLGAAIGFISLWGMHLQWLGQRPRSFLSLLRP